MDEKLPHVQDGEEFTAEAFNEAAARIERFLNLRVAEGASGGLTLYKDRYGMVLSYQPPAWTLATLSGSTSPYSWHEAAPASSGTWSNYGVRSGTSNAYEINGVAGLGGKVVRMWWTGAGDWRFAYPRRGSTPCTGGTGQICAYISDDGCAWSMGDRGMAGATITVLDHTGALVGTVATTGVVHSLSGGGGSGYTNGTGYALGYTGGGGGSGFTGTFDVVGGSVTNLQITNQGSAFTSNITLTFPGAGSGTGASGTGTVLPQGCVAVPSTGSYTVKVDFPGTSTLTQTVSVSTCTKVTVGFSYPANTFGAINCGVISNCSGGNLSGANVTVTQGSTVFGPITTGVGGNAFFGHVPSPGGGTTVTVTASRFASGSAFIANLAPCGTDTVNVTLSPDSSHTCICVGSSGCPVPAKLTLTLTDSVYGSCTLTYNAGTSQYLGSNTVSYPGCHVGIFTCPASTVTINYAFTVTPASGCILVVSCKEATAGGCPTDAGASGGSTNVAGIGITGVTCPPAYAGTFTINSGNVSGCSLLYPTTQSGGTVTITVSE